MPEEINFYLRDEKYGWLSNFHRAEQTLYGVHACMLLTYPTNEHFYQASKAKDEDVARWIASAPTPFLAMCAGRSLRKGKELRDDWEEIKVACMRAGLFAKFEQNEDLKQKLLATGNARLCEDSPTDMFWGKKGKNMLGDLLMIVRKEIRNTKACTQKE